MQNKLKNPPPRGIKNTSAHTYAEDMAEVIEDDKTGLVKKIIHEEERHEIEKTNLSPESKKNELFLFTSLVLVFLSAGILTFFFFGRNISTIDIAPVFTPLIFNDQNYFLEVAGFNKDQIIASIKSEAAATAQNKGVEGIYLTENKQILDFRKFSALIKSNLPNNSLINDNFLLGTVRNSSPPARLPAQAGAGGDLFILLKVSSISDLFSIFRTWEGKMFYDLHGFFGKDVNFDTKYLLTKDFEDGVVENKNARILYDKDGQIVMIYIFADDHSIIITGTEAAAREVMLRLTSSRVKK